MDLRDLISQYRDQILLVGAFVIGLMIMGSIVFFASQDQFLSNYPVTSSTPGQANASSSGPSHLDQDQQELAEDSDANSTPQTETRQQTPALWGTFNISSVLLNGAKWSCQQGRVQLTIPSVQVKADSNRGGDFTWQLEVKNGSGPSSPPVPPPFHATNPPTSSPLAATNRFTAHNTPMTNKPSVYVSLRPTRSLQIGS